MIDSDNLIRRISFKNRTENLLKESFMDLLGVNGTVALTLDTFSNGQ
jgi:hypothetical protein